MSTNDPTFTNLSVACSNCCQLLFPKTEAGPDDCNGNHGFESHPVYELTQEEQVLAISSVLERIYRFEQLRDLHDYEEESVENAPLCQKCANILNQMDILHQEFDRLRDLESYLSKKIDQVDEIIRDGIVNLKLQQITEEHAKENNINVEGNSGIIVVKTEVEEPLKTTLFSGPWVVLRRLKNEEIPGHSQTDHEDSNIDPLEDNGNDYIPDIDFEPNFSEDESNTIPCEDYGSRKQKRVSRRIRNKSAAKSSLMTDKLGTSIISVENNSIEYVQHDSLEFKPISVGDNVTFNIFEKDTTTSSGSNKKRRISARKSARSRTKSNQVSKVETKITPTRLKPKIRIGNNKRKYVQGKHVYKSTTDVVQPNEQPRESIRGRLLKARTREFYQRKKVHPYPCYYCLSDFDVESQRVEHLKDAHCTQDKSVICPACGKLFTSELGKKNHESKCGLIHPRFTVFGFPCKDCGKEFKYSQTLKYHQNKIHSTKRPFACDECDHRFIAPNELQFHKKYSHALPERTRCTECNKMVKSSFFNEHFTNLHTPEGRLKYYARREAIKARNKVKYWQNRITTSVCTECNIDFQTVARYKNHRNEVHASTKKLKWQCEQCGKGFDNLWVFKKHQEFVHTNERPYICEKCGMRFKSPSYLRFHMERVHTEEGRLKYREYDKLNLQRRKMLAQELLLKTQEASKSTG